MQPLEDGNAEKLIICLALAGSRRASP